MKTAILCGGAGTRLSEETEVTPKPLINIGNWPILWHIMKGYSAYGTREFVLALGYKGDRIKDFFINYHLRSKDLTVETSSGQIDIHSKKGEDWKVTLIDTGTDTQTGGRIKRLQDFIGNETFMLTYGDGVADINIAELLKTHKKHGKLATVTAVRPPARFGEIVLDGGTAKCFKEKPQIGEGWINGGFFVLEPGIFDYIDDDSTLWERKPMEKLAADNQLAAYKHPNFWQCMDTMRDKRLLEELWNSNKAPWKTW